MHGGEEQKREQGQKEGGGGGEGGWAGTTQEGWREEDGFIRAKAVHELDAARDRAN